MPVEYDPSRVALYSPERRDTVFVGGVDYSREQLGVEAARLAYVRAEVSEADRLRLTAALARVEFGPPALFRDSRTSSEGFAAMRPRDGTALVAFRGTQPDDVADLATDLRANAVAWPESGGRVHAGFAAAARSIMPQLRQWIDESELDINKLILTGHSLGGAIATLAATLWPAGLLVTLGSPRVGDSEFAARLSSTTIVRFVNCCDVVTELPPPLGGYVHVRGGTYITADGARVENPTDELIARDRQRARIDYTTRHAWRIGSVLVRDLADHAPINYLRAIFP
jgi:Lipase (class 3)